LGHAAIDFGKHWVDIAAFHCFLLLLGAVGLFFACQGACDYWEDQFAKRIFGYYLSLTEAPLVEGKQNADHEELFRDISPRSPYHVFSLADAANDAKPPAAPEEASKGDGPQTPSGPATPVGEAPQRRLEPSAVRILGNLARVIVANDQGGQQPFWLFTINDDATELTNPVPIPLSLNKFFDDIQSLAVFEDGEQSPTCKDSIHVFALPTAFVDKDIKTGTHLVSFCLDARGRVPSVSEVLGEELPFPCPDNATTCTVEGLTVFPDGRTFLFGIHSIDGKPAVAITRSTRLGPGKWTAFESVFPGPKGTPASLKGMKADPADGLSDLAAAPSGRIYVTVSRQKDIPWQERAGRSRHGKGALSDVGGSLWLVDVGCGPNADRRLEECRQPTATLLETFIHKPKGVATDNGSVLVVFDDEAPRKSRQWAPVTFPLGQDESVFVVVPSPEHR
jgi:hypothetical protein